MFLSLVVAAFRAAENRDPTPQEVLNCYHDCRVRMTPKWVYGVQQGEVPVLEMVDQATFAIWVNNPSAVLQNALSYSNNGWRGRQEPDQDLFVPQHFPRDYKLTYTLLNFRRSSSDGHWVLGDRSGMNILYNPDENLDINWWERSPKWRAIKIWHV